VPLLDVTMSELPVASALTAIACVSLYSGKNPGTTPPVIIEMP